MSQQASAGIIKQICNDDLSRPTHASRRTPAEAIEDFRSSQRKAAPSNRRQDFRGVSNRAKPGRPSARSQAMAKLRR